MPTVQNIEQSFGVVPIYRKGNDLKLLLIQHNAGHWAFPKGHADEGDRHGETEVPALGEASPQLAKQAHQRWPDQDVHLIEEEDEGPSRREGSQRPGHLVDERVAETDYHLKAQAKQFWGFLAMVQEIRRGVRKARDQAAP